MKLFGMPGWGSAIVEYQLVWYGFDYDFVETGDLFDNPGADDALKQVNPLRQIPTLVLDDGTVMTESAAITLLLADMTDDDSLVPPPGSDTRASFLRWLVFIVANVYPTYTYVDDPSRFVPVEAAQAPFSEAVHDYAKALYVQMESAARIPWFLGDRFSALDIYIAVITRWTPKRDWHAENCPKLFAIAQAVDSQEELVDVVSRNQGYA